jgi:hypothetical protein
VKPDPRKLLALRKALAARIRGRWLVRCCRFDKRLGVYLRAPAVPVDAQLTADRADARRALTAMHYGLYEPLPRAAERTPVPPTRRQLRTAARQARRAARRAHRKAYHG